MGSFAADISKFVEKTKISGEVVLRKIALDALRGVVMKTPVDTGRARGNWRVAINTTDTTTDDDGYGLSQYGSTFVRGFLAANPHHTEANGAAAAAKAISAGSANIAKARWADSIVISNNLPYIEPLENGHSRQGQGMLRLTFAEISASIERAVAAMGGP